MAYAQYLPLSAIPYSCSMSASLSIYLHPLSLPHPLTYPLRCLCNVHLRFISVRPCRAYPPDMASDFRFALQRTRNQLSLRLTACPTYLPVRLSASLSVCQSSCLPSVRLSISQPGVACQAWVSELWHLRGLRSESFRFRLWLQSWLHLSIIPTPPAPCTVLPVRKLCLPPFPISFADIERISAHLSCFRVCPVCLSICPFVHVHRRVFACPSPAFGISICNI